MTVYTAGRLDARNIGSSIGVDMGEGEFIFGTVTAIHRKQDKVLIYLADNEDPLELDRYVDVDVHLSPVGLHTLHSKNELERIRHLLTDLTAGTTATPHRSTLKAV